MAPCLPGSKKPWPPTAMHFSAASSRISTTPTNSWGSVSANKRSRPIGTSRRAPPPPPALHADFREDLARIDVPTLVIQGDADRILPIAATALRTAKLIKGARQLIVKDGPHAVTWTHAEEVNDGLLRFLGEKTSNVQNKVA